LEASVVNAKQSRAISWKTGSPLKQFRILPNSTTIHTTLAAFRTAFAALLADKTAAQRRQATLEAAAAAAAAFVMTRLLLVLHLVLRRVVALLGPGAGIRLRG